MINLISYFRDIFACHGYEFADDACRYNCVIKREEFLITASEDVYDCIKATSSSGVLRLEYKNRKLIIEKNPLNCMVDLIHLLKRDQCEHCTIESSDLSRYDNLLKDVS